MNVVLKHSINCADCPIRHRAVCSNCNEDELAMLNDMKVYRQYKAGEQILWRGDDLAFVATLVEGVATLSRTMEDGRTQLLGMLLPSDFIGRPKRTTVEFDVIAVTDVKLCCFDRKPFDKLIDETPHLSQRLMEIALDELDAARDWMLLLGRKTAREKIATFLTMLLRRSSKSAFEGGSVPLALPLTREEIANYLGLTLETVSRQLNGLKGESVIRFHDRRRFEVTDHRALYTASGDDSGGDTIFA